MMQCVIKQMPRTVTRVRVAVRDKTVIRYKLLRRSWDRR